MNWRCSTRFGIINRLACVAGGARPRPGGVLRAGGGSGSGGGVRLLELPRFRGYPSVQFPTESESGLSVQSNSPKRDITATHASHAHATIPAHATTNATTTTIVHAAFSILPTYPFPSCPVQFPTESGFYLILICSDTRHAAPTIPVLYQDCLYVSRSCMCQDPFQADPEAHKQPDQRPNAGSGPALQAPGSADADHLAQEQPEVETRDVHQQALQDVRSLLNVYQESLSRCLSATP